MDNNDMIIEPEKNNTVSEPEVTEKKGYPEEKTDDFADDDYDDIFRMLDEMMDDE